MFIRLCINTHNPIFWVKTVVFGTVLDDFLSVVVNVIRAEINFNFTRYIDIDYNY